jgi:hypothetical protein
MNKRFLIAMLIVLALGGSALAGNEPDGSMRTWLDADYLLWWLQSAPVSQPLLTTGPPSVISGLSSGILGNPGTEVLAGNSTMNSGPYSGFRINGGWINCANTIGVEGSFFYLPQHAVSEAFASDPNGFPLLARPLVDGRTGQETVEFVSSPGAFANSAGFFNVTSSTALLGADGNVLLPWCRGCCDDEIIPYLNFLGGFRYLNLREELDLTQQTNILPLGIGFFNGLPVQSPGSLILTDTYHTLNQFYGGQVGVQGGFVWWRFTLSGIGKIAFGSDREEANIGGTSTATRPLLGALTIPGGVLNQTTNFGNYTRNMFAVVPEGNLNLSVEITSQIKLMVGYTFLYISNVARPGDLIDRTVDRTLLPTSQAYNPVLPNSHRPAFQWNGTDFWAQGINVGLSLRF